MNPWDFIVLFRAELFLFCAFFFLLGALDDLGFDILYVWRRFRGRLKKPVPVADILSGKPLFSAPIAVYVPAWREAEVIEQTLNRMADAFAGSRRDRDCAHDGDGDGDGDVTIFVGCYPNDDATLDAVRRAMARHRHIRLAINERAGPTTKGDCLNAIWTAMIAEERNGHRRYGAILLHDAEDIVHAEEIVVHRHYLPARRLSQLPVIPIVPKDSPWLAGHYADEFAEAHGKELRVRETSGAALPSAGVGCAFRRDYMDERAASGDQSPFPSSSLVEDYELGLSLGQSSEGAKDDAANVRQSTLALIRGSDGALVATRAVFPSDLDAVVRQKARWIAGIALAGWDRLGWHSSFGEIWMRLHDRRSIFAALVIALSYFLFALSFLLILTGEGAGLDAGLPNGWRPLLYICFLNFIYRMAVRAWFVRHMQGWRQALMSLPRTFVANIIAIMASWRAVLIYARHCLGAPLNWDKTRHRPYADGYGG